MDKNNFYFYISGGISLSLFFIVIGSFSYMLFSDSKVQTFALNKKDYISISLNTNFDETNSKNSIQKDITVPEVIEENLNIDDLFSNVSTKKISKKKIIKSDAKRYNEIARKVKTSKKNDVELLSDKINNMNIQESNNKQNNDSSANEVNEYLAKIQAIVYRHFNPPENSQGYTVKAVIELSALGKVLDFRILNYSTNVALNQECDKINNRLRGVLFPLNPDKNSFTTIVNLKSDED